MPLSGIFTLSVEINSYPGSGYTGIQTEIDYGSLVYKPTDTAAEELVWPDSLLSLRVPPTPTGVEGLINHWNVSEAMPPLRVSTHTGNVVEIEVHCSASDSVNTINLIPYSADNTDATGLRDVNTAYVPASDSLVINCGG